MEMPRAYAMDLRERVVAAAHEEKLTGTLTRAALAERFRVSEGTVYNWLKSERDTGTVAPKPHGGGHPRSVDARGESVLTALVEARNDRTLEELATLYRAETAVGLSQSALWRALKRAGFVRKKSP